MKKIFGIALIFVMFATTQVAAYYAPSAEERIAGLEATIAALLAQLDAAPDTNHQTVRRQREEAAQLERLMFRFSYYGLCMKIAHNDFLAEQLVLTRRQLELETVRRELGFATQTNVNELAALVASIELQLDQNAVTIPAEKRHIETRRSRTGYEFIRDFSVPSPGNTRVGSADALRENLIQNNVALTVLDGHINQASRHRVHHEEIRMMNEQRDLLTRQLEMAAIAGWNGYHAARVAFEQATAEAPLLETRLALIYEMFELGEISEVNKMAMRFAVRAEKHATDMAAIALAMSIAELEFMMLGISSM